MNTSRTRIRLICGVASAFAVALGGCAAPVRDTARNVDTPAPACVPPAVAGDLFLRSDATDWNVRDDYAFDYRCDKYVLTTPLSGRHAFRIGDAKSDGGLSFGAATSEMNLLPDSAAMLSGGPGAHVGKLEYDFHGDDAIEVRFPAATRDGAPSITIRHATDEDAAAPVTDSIARSLQFDSRDAAHKIPFGAVTAGSTVELRLSALPGVDKATLVVEKRKLEGAQERIEYSEVARVPLQRSTDGARERWSGDYRFADIGVYGYYFVVDIAGRQYLYANNADPIYWTRELGSNGIGAVVAATPAQRIRRFRQTVYRGDYRVPDWARDIVYYAIFPERFRNGDPGNDPRPGIDKFHEGTVEFHKNWLDKPYVPRSGDGSDDQYSNDFFGGDLQGIIDKLGYIADLGANTLYINPIFRAASNHKYDTADYRSIDPHFGSNADFERLTREASRRGLRVVLDTSVNHTGRDSIYFNLYGNFPGVGALDRGKIRTDSLYASWYTFYPDRNDASVRYKGWVGISDLPELDKSQRSVRDFFYGADDSVMKLWLDRGASGWRMDVAPWVPDDYWREWRQAVKAHKPDALTVAETQFDSSKFLLGDEFDSTMNYIFRNAVEAYANGTPAPVAYRNIELMRENYPPQAFFALMNLLSTHDTARALYDFGWRDEHADPSVIALAKRRLRLAVLFQMIFPGAPTVFYGDEVGVTGGDDPFNRVTYPWSDRGGKPDKALLGQYKQLIAMRKSYPVLRHGSIDAPAYIDDHVIVLIRRDGDQWAVTATNNDDVPHAVAVPLPTGFKATHLKDVLTGALQQASDGYARFTVPPLSGVVLIAMPPPPRS